MSRRTFLPLPLFVAVLGSAALACSSRTDKDDNGTNLGGDAGDDGGIHVGDSEPLDVGVFNGVTITPSNAVLTIDTASTPAKPATQTYTVKVRRDDGSEDDVSAAAKFNIDPKYGSFAGNVYTSPNALPDGKPSVTIISADVAGTDGSTKTGQAQITLIALRKTGDKRDFFFLEPYNQEPSPSKDVLKFGTNIKQVDVAFLMDTTGSMGGVITGLKTSLSTTIIPTLKKTIPSVGIAVAGHDDFPVNPYGSADIDQPFYLLQTVTTSVTAAQAGVNALTTHGGNDGPESQYEGVYQVLTGEGVSWTTGLIKKKTNAPGTYGYVDFRPGSLPVVVLMSDANFHPKSDYAGLTGGGGSIISGMPEPHGLDEVKAAYDKTHARHVGISTTSTKGPVGSYTSFPQNSELCEASGSYVSPKVFKDKCGAGKCCTDAGGAARDPDGPGGTCLLNFMSSISGSDISSSIVDAIAALSAGSNFDVTAKWSNDPANPDGVDASKFIKALRAMKEGDVSQGCPATEVKDTDGDGVDDTFIGVTVGVPVCFEVIPQKNTTVKPTKAPQFFNAFIDVLGMPGAVKLDQRTVLFLVPPADIVAK